MAPWQDNTRQAPARQGTVVVLPGKSHGTQAGHEMATHHALAQQLAAIMEFEFGGNFDASRRYVGSMYFVPSDTLVNLRDAIGLGIHNDACLFGGVVPFPFVATKTITHPLLYAGAQAPQGWSPRFAQEVADVVLPGYSAFTPDDVTTAALRLLQQGPVRIKLASGTGGLGQWVVRDREELQACLDTLDSADVMRDGVVCEHNLADVTTASVGQVKVGALLASYYGEQRLTVNNRGEKVYGGSDLIVVRGDFDALLGVVSGDEPRTAVAQACTYHAAALASFAGMFASRCNYDIARGIDDQGRVHSGVLEQSWRIGGASGAEIVALDAFRRNPALGVVRASTTEVYGVEPALPADALVYFSGTDEQAGPITKYARLEGYVNP